MCLTIFHKLRTFLLDRFFSFFFCVFNSVDFRYFKSIPVLSQCIEKTRTYLLKCLGAEIGQNSYVRYDLFITNPKLLHLGNSSKLGIRSELFLYSDLSIGDNVEIGSDLIVHTSDHNLSDPNMPLCKQGGVPRPVIIGSNVYIGSRVTILSGVVVDDYVVIGAGSVVTTNLGTGYIYGGIPAKRIKKIHADC